MQLKSERELYRRRRNTPWLQWFAVMLLLGIGGYIGYLILVRLEAQVVTPATPTPAPTATPSPLLYVAQAEEAYWRADVRAAITDYQNALDLEPNQTEVYVTLARLLILQEQPERGLLMAKEALRRQPDNARAWALVGLAYDWLGLPYEAIAACERALELDPTLPEAYAYLAEAYMDAGNWFAANDAIATAMELDDANVDVLRNYGYVLENQGNYYGAIEFYEKALEIRPLGYIYTSIGRNAGAVSNLPMARDAYKEAVKIDPNNALLLDNLGWVYLLLGDYDNARTVLRQALDLNPINSDAATHLATLYYYQRNYEGAIELFLPAIRYGEARSRRRTVFFVITEEDLSQVGTAPSSQVLARAEFVHPLNVDMPLRATFNNTEGDSPFQGYVRLDVVNGRYSLRLTQMAQPSSGKVYMGWFIPLLTPERATVHTAPIFPAPDGRVELEGETGTVKGPPIETYYTLGLCYYYLDECNNAQPYIQTALRLDPEDANARQTLSLCQQ
ncbi:MAG TPA: tetratricopeptide repeat protein [Anaerolineae bacterium]|nr:tetratricopeptide repeat protein [Anaerolineae bacterium]